MNQSEITEERRKIRESLEGSGFTRISYTHDENNSGEYQEVWTGLLGVITLQWFSNNKAKPTPPNPATIAPL